jgi:hypothetical protein
VTGGMLGNPDLGRGRFDDPLEDRWVPVMAPLLGGPGIRPALLLREQELPAPLRGRASVELRVRSGARSCADPIWPPPAGVPGGALARRLLPTQPECQVAEQTAENGVPRVTCTRLHVRQAHAFNLHFRQRDGLRAS